MRVLNPPGFTSRWTAWAVGLAVAVPPLVAYSPPPNGSLFKQLASVGLWGLVLVLHAMDLARRQGQLRWHMTPLGWAVLVLWSTALVTPWWRGQPWSLALSNLGVLTPALVLAWLTPQLSDADKTRWFRAIAWGLLLAASLNALVGVVQTVVPANTYWPGWMNGSPGQRPIGNIMQANNLADLLLLGMLALVWLNRQATGMRAHALGWPMLWMFGLVFVLYLVGSRMGLIGLLALFIYGVADLRLPMGSRRLLLFIPVLWLVSLGLHSSLQPVLGEFSTLSRLESSGLGSEYRLAMLKFGTELIYRYPWFGVGWDEMLRVGNLTPGLTRTAEVFNHTHNAVVQLVVTIGLPLGALVLALLGYALLPMARQAWGSEQNDATLWRKVAFLMLAVVGLHSLLEYPLWYAYFLLPCVALLGLGAQPAALSPSKGIGSRVTVHVLASMGLAIAVGAGWATQDYLKVVDVFQPADPAIPGRERLDTAKGTTFFRHYAIHTEATSARVSAQQVVMLAPEAAHMAADPKLLRRWAEALYVVGDVDRARFLAQRYKEMAIAKQPYADASWFAVCSTEVAGMSPQPFQCLAPRWSYRPEDFAAHHGMRKKPQD